MTGLGQWNPGGLAGVVLLPMRQCQHRLTLRGPERPRLDAETLMGCQEHRCRCPGLQAPGIKGFPASTCDRSANLSDSILLPLPAVLPIPALGFPQQVLPK